ncbi:MAG TPA: M48 family metallopeptidase, partial [Bacteroidia bacterium]|nr:M48 family metallopeptidase [Bacteroidia bacterium]
MRNLGKFLAPVLFFYVLPATGQTPEQRPDMDNYQPARSNGPLPSAFLTSTTEKIKEDRKKIDLGLDKGMQKTEDDFYMQTNYAVDQLRFSGTVLVNDTMGMYVNRVADTLLAGDPELRKKLTFFILRSQYVNAFTTNEGAIFVTVGLLTRLHNEAELAMVLAHEIIHYKRQHVITGYVEGEKARQGIGQYEATTFENRFLKRHRYARNQESQADEEGFDLLIASNYDPQASVGAFDILALAEAPFSDAHFDKSFFESNYFVFPSKFQPDTVKAVKPADDDEDDDLATHPSVYKRRKAMMKRFGKLNAADTSGKQFLVSELMFYRVREIARFEECAEHIGDTDYSPAIYSNYS